MKEGREKMGLDDLLRFGEQRVKYLIEQITGDIVVLLFHLVDLHWKEKRDNSYAIHKNLLNSIPTATIENCIFNVIVVAFKPRIKHGLKRGKN